MLTPSNTNTNTTTSKHDQKQGKDLVQKFDHLLAVCGVGGGDDKRDDDAQDIIVDVASSSNADEDDEDDTDLGEGTFQIMKATKKESPSRGRGVRFGSVRVHKHNLTLGDNPAAKTVGPPVTLDWKAEENIRYSNIDEFAIDTHGRRDSQVLHATPKKLSSSCRERIAKLDHSAGSIRRIKVELYDIKQGREESSKEDIDRALALQEEEEKAKQERRQAKKGGLFGGLFKHFFN